MNVSFLFFPYPERENKFVGDAKQQTKKRRLPVGKVALGCAGVERVKIASDLASLLSRDLGLVRGWIDGGTQ